MFNGNMIDDLINSVERAERHAREVEILKMELRDFSAVGQTDPLPCITV